MVYGFDLKSRHKSKVSQRSEHLSTINSITKTYHTETHTKAKIPRFLNHKVRLRCYLRIQILTGFDLEKKPKSKAPKMGQPQGATTILITNISSSTYWFRFREEYQEQSTQDAATSDEVEGSDISSVVISDVT